MPRVRLNKRAVETRCSLPPGKAQVVWWDTEVRGLGLLVGRTAKTFVLQRRFPGGRARRVTIGRYPTWSPEMARRKAREMILDISRGVDPVAERLKAEARRVTLAQAAAEHADRLRAKGGSERSVENLEGMLQGYLGDWMKRPLAEITKGEARARHARITKDRGRYAANQAFRQFRAVYNSALKVHDLPAVNPAVGVFWNKEHRRQEPIPWEKLPAWAEKVARLSPVRRDFQHFVLLTGLRSTDAATVRWEHVDFGAGTIHRPKPKGGADRAFTVPLCARALEVLEGRREGNLILRGPDCPWAFPAETGGPIVERRLGRGEPTPHRLRDTFATAAREAGVGWWELKVLMNHALPTGDVTAGYVAVSVEHLRACVERVAEFLLGKMALKDRAPLQSEA